MQRQRARNARPACDGRSSRASSDADADFLTNPNHPLRRQLAALHHAQPSSDRRTAPGSILQQELAALRDALGPDDDFLTNQDNPIRQALVDTEEVLNPFVGYNPARVVQPTFARGEVDFASVRRVGREAEAPFTPPDVVSRLLPPPRRFETAEVDTECAVCLEPLAGHSCCVAPCLHVLHCACLKEWLRRSPKCPVCKLDLASPSREMRYRLADLASLNDAELRHFAIYLRACKKSAPQIHRGELEMSIMCNSHVHVLCRREQLLEMPVGRLKSLAKTVDPASVANLVEKTDLVNALLSSSKFTEDTAKREGRWQAMSGHAHDPSTPNEPSAHRGTARRAAPY